MPTYPQPPAYIGDAFNFEDILEALFYTLLSTDTYLAAIGVAPTNVYTRRSLNVQATPRIELDVDMSSNMDYMSFIIQGNPPRQTPNAFIGNVTMRVVTTRAVDSLLGTPLHGKIRGRCRYIMSAPADLISSLSPAQYLQILELLPGSATMDIQADKDTDTTFLSYRMKFAINDWAWPVICEEPHSVSVVHPTGTTWTPVIFLPQQATCAFQWQVSTNGGSSWSNTTDGATYSGSATAALTILGTTTGMNAYQYRLVITTAAYSTTVNSSAATLTVT